jgi:hypothetical protein
MPIVETHLTAQGFEILIGRDLLRNFKLLYDGQASTFALSY